MAKKWIVAAMLANISALLLWPKHSEAVLECCFWPFNGRSDPVLSLKYVNYGDSWLAPKIDAAANEWSGTASPPLLTSDFSGPISVAAGNPQCGWCGGWTTIAGNPLTSASIVMNEAYLKASGTSYQTALVVHEFGHSLGLAHSDGTGCSSVIYSNLTLPHATLSPSAYDVSQLNTAYPTPGWPPSGAC